MKRKIWFAIASVFIFLVFTACPDPDPPPVRKPHPYYFDGVGLIVVWKGESETLPLAAQRGWAYYDTVDEKAYMYKGANYWQVLPQKNVSLIWNEDTESPPEDPQLNWAYYNSTDEKTYIWNGVEWQVLLKDSVIGPEGFLSLEILMEWIPAGTFTMGSPESELQRGNDEIQHQVTLSGFYMGKYQVTQEQFYLVMEWDPSYFDGATGYEPIEGEKQLKRPVERVTWYEAIEFCNRLSMKEGLSPAYSLDGETDPDEWGPKGWAWDDVEMVSGATGYRLPTEAEWEYACRAGTDTAFNWGTDQITTEQANFDGSVYLYNNSPIGKYRNKTTEVGIFAPNAFGLYDMHGNVLEWCWDWYGRDYYEEESPDKDPQGPTFGAHRVSRGGSWYYAGNLLRSAKRLSYDPGDRFSDQGFRLVRP